MLTILLLFAVGGISLLVQLFHLSRSRHPKGAKPLPGPKGTTKPEVLQSPMLIWKVTLDCHLLATCLTSTVTPMDTSGLKSRNVAESVDQSTCPRRSARPMSSLERRKSATIFYESAVTSRARGRTCQWRLSCKAITTCRMAVGFSTANPHLRY